MHLEDMFQYIYKNIRLLAFSLHPNSDYSCADSNTEPQDRYHGIYFAMLLAGVGFLLPYNSFITDVDYLHQKFPGLLKIVSLLSFTKHMLILYQTAEQCFFSCSHDNHVSNYMSLISVSFAQSHILYDFLPNVYPTF